MIIWHIKLLGDDQEVVEQVEQKTISEDQVEEIKHNLDDRRDYPEDNNNKHAQIEFIQLKDDQQITYNQ